MANSNANMGQVAATMQKSNAAEPLQYGQVKSHINHNRTDQGLMKQGGQQNNNGGMQQYYQVNTNIQNRLNGVNTNKGFMTSFDPQTFKSQPAPSSSRLKQR